MQSRPRSNVGKKGALFEFKKGTSTLKKGEKVVMMCALDGGRVLLLGYPAALGSGLQSLVSDG